MRRYVHLAAVSVMVTATALAAFPGAAQADLVTHCVGTGGAVTVPNDLLVPAGQSCALTGTTVTGNITVQAGANLVASGGKFSGSVTVAGNGYLDTSDTTIGGAVVLASGGFGAFLKDSSTGTVTVRAKGSSTVDTFLFAENAKVTGHVNVSAGEVRLDANSSVTGNVSSTGTYYTDVLDSFVDGTLSVLNSATGSVVCGGSVRGRSTFAGNLGGVQLGPDGALASCASGGYFGRDVSITNTTGGVTVNDSIIDGTLTVTANTPAAVVADNNRIRGGVVTDPAATQSRSAQSRAVSAEPREDDSEARAEARRTVAVQSAVAAGDAGL